MNWIHWTEKEPEDNEWIFVYHEPYLDDPPLMGRLRYKRCGNGWEAFKNDPTYERYGWTYWASYSDIPLPINKRIKMNWIKINDRMELPRDSCKPFLALWKGRISLCQYDSDEDRFYISFDPAIYEACWKIDQDRENKFTHWMPLPEMPEDY